MRNSKALLMIHKAKQRMLEHVVFADILNHKPLQLSAIDKGGYGTSFKASFKLSDFKIAVSQHNKYESSNNAFVLDILSSPIKLAAIDLKKMRWRINHFWREPTSTFPFVLVGAFLLYSLCQQARFQT